MFANFIEETCTGIGVTLALAGATTGNIQFQKKYADGDSVFYVLEDSGGTIRVGGVGTYVSATDDIIRNDYWSWNGTTYDENPTTNITLSGGTHTIRCDLLEKNISNAYQDGVNSTNYYIGHNLVFNQIAGTPGQEFGATVGRLVIMTIVFFHPVKITDVGIFISTAAAAGNARVGLYHINPDGSPGSLILDSGDIATDATGSVFNTLANPVILPAGRYYMADYADNTTVRAWGVRSSEGGVLASALGGRTATAPDAAERKLYYNLTYGALPSTLGTPDGNHSWATLGGLFR